MSTAPITYEYNRIADRKRLDFIAAALKHSLPANAHILDVGCGNGVISRHLGQLGYDVLGIDVSDKTIANARQLNKLPNVRFEVISAEELVAQGNSYDAIICSEVLEHLSKPELLLEVLYKSLKNDGKLIITVPNGNGPRELLVTRHLLALREKNNWLWRLILKMKKTFGYQGSTVQSSADNLDHVQFFSRADLRQLSASNNFRIVKYGKANFVEDVFPFSFLAKRFTFLQKIDCMIADILPFAFTGGFFTVWEKKKEAVANVNA